jgi:hypothetical protein
MARFNAPQSGCFSYPTSEKKRRSVKLHRSIMQRYLEDCLIDLACLVGVFRQLVSLARDHVIQHH